MELRDKLLAALIVASVAVIVGVLADDPPNGVSLFTQQMPAYWEDYVCGIGDWVCPEDFKPGAANPQISCAPIQDLDCCVCNSSVPDICATSPWKNYHCETGCMVGDTSDPRQIGQGRCVACADVTVCINDDQCPYNCHCIAGACEGIAVPGVCGTNVNNNCTSGVLNDIADNSTHYLWECLGIEGGANDSCNLLKSSAMVNGACGPAAKSYVASEPFPAGLPYCLSGDANPPSPADPPMGGLSSWICQGQNGGTNATCNATRGVVYDGFFNNGRSNAEVVVFSVIFTDSSQGASRINWTFENMSSIGCISAEYTQPLPNPIAFNRGEVKTVGTLRLATLPNTFCAVIMTAMAPDNNIVLGFYNLTPGTAGIPSTQIPEIPAIIHPTNIYSAKLDDAIRAFDSGKTTVNSLSVECATYCPAAATAALANAVIHINAAEFYLGTCTSDGQPECRLSQYYSDRAQELAAEGLALIRP